MAKRKSSSGSRFWICDTCAKPFDVKEKAEAHEAKCRIRAQFTSHPALLRMVDWDKIK